MLPEPTLSFTLPSIHDDMVLDCRIYHPQSLSPSPKSPPWKRHAAIMAHPYAPLGGCYDDPIVDTVSEALLRTGYLVGTFNFRGASNSAGRTSWTAKPERADYMSFVGFVVYYIHFLDPFAHHEPLTPCSPLAAQSNDRNPSRPVDGPVLLLGGYSYGAMITTQIPSMDIILAKFSAPAVGSAAAEIRLRAEHLAEQQNTVLGSARAAHRTSPRKSLGMRVGGDEGDHRKSHDSRRSFSLDAEEKIRRGVNELLAKTKIGHHHHRHNQNEPKSPAGTTDKHGDIEQHLEPVLDLIAVKPAYVLVSPLQGVITHLATMSYFSSATGRFFSRSPAAKPKEGGGDAAASYQPADTAEKKLVLNPTLAIYGDRDVFVPVSKLRAWKARLAAVEGSQFRGEEIATAGHFWVEEKVLYVLRDLVVDFATGLLHGS